MLRRFQLLLLVAGLLAAAGCGSSNPTPTVTAPSITTQPQNQTITSGQTAMLSVVASGSNLTYQWYQGSSPSPSNPISGATSSSYTTPALTETTSYWVQVSNSAGTANSATATITVNAAAPSITTQPKSQAITTGQTAMLTVVASGSNLTYQWYLGASGDQSNPISGATGSSYTTPALTATTSYWVQVSNSAGMVNSATATITVNPPPPSITTEPLSQTINSGQTAMLSVVATGSNLTYQWYQGSSASQTNPISGATSSSYTTPALTATTSYWVQVSNSGGTANSTTATITVIQPPMITTQPLSQTISTGLTATLSVVATGTNLTYQWYVGSTGNQSNPISGATSSSYMTAALTSTTSYWVQVKNSAGSVNSSTATITVTTGPVITTQPQSQTIASGHTATLTVVATGSSLTYQWYVGSSPNQTNPISGATSSSYTTPALTSTTSYWVQVSNGSGNANSTTATITVNPPPPVITTEPMSQTIASGQTANLTVVATGTGLTYQWYQGSSGNVSSPISGATSSSYTTPALTTTTSYWVQVSNTGGTANSTTATITVTVSISLTAISPTTIGAGTPGFQITATGTGFTNTTSIEFNGTALTTTFVSSTQLTAIVPHSDIASAGTASITVSGDTVDSKTLTIAASVTLAWDTSLKVQISGLSFSNAPIRLAFDPGDNSLFVAEQATGHIDRVLISHGTGTPAVWATVSTCMTASTCSSTYLGLLGMAIDPSDPPSSGGSVYVYYSASSTENRIAKISKGGSVSDLVTGLPAAGDANSGDYPYLNGGMLAVHKDPSSGTTYLYASTGGSDYYESYSQDTSGTGELYGKILRYETNGTAAGASAFSGTAIYACGVRNSFGFDFHPDGALYATDNGNEGLLMSGSTLSAADTWYDALDRVQPGGGNAEGFGYASTTRCASLSETDPLIGGATDQTLSTQSHVPTGTVFYTNALMPQLQNTVVVTGNYVNNIYQYSVDEYNTSTPGDLLGSTNIISMPNSNVFSPTDLVQGPDGCIYMSALDANSTPYFIYRFGKSGGSCQ